MSTLNYNSFGALFNTCKQLSSVADNLDGDYTFDLMFGYDYDTFMTMSSFEFSTENVIIHQDEDEFSSVLIVPMKLIGASNIDIVEYVMSENKRLAEEYKQQKLHDYDFYRSRIAELEKEIDEIRKRQL